MYDAQKAVAYAKKYYNHYNQNYYNFTNIGGDCTNFISQCLYAGDIDMYYPGWYYYSINDRAPSWTGVDEFFNFVTTNTAGGVRAKLVDLKEIKVGDVIQLGDGARYFHTLLVTKIVYPINYNNIYVAAHDRDAFDRVLNSYIFKTIRCLSIQGWRLNILFFIGGI